MIKTFFILYVDSQEESTEFYKEVLACEPFLLEPGMAEFELSETCYVALVPRKDIKRILGDALPDPDKARGIPKAEIYIVC